MSEQNEQETGGLRRIGRKDRKKRLEARKPLFPDDDPALPPAEGDDHERFKPPAAANEVPPLPPERDVMDLEDDRFPPIKPQAAKTAKSAAALARRRFRFWPNFLSVVFFLATIAAGVYVAILARDPYSPLNLFPPFTPVPIFITTTPLPPTLTPTLTLTPTTTFTPISRDVLATQVTWTPAPFPFTLVETGIAYSPNRNEQGCNWASIAGSVTGLQGEGLEGYRVQVVGDNFNETVVTGSALAFGPGGYEMRVAGAPLVAEFAVQLLTPEGIPISEVVYVTTRDVCDEQTQENVSVVSFVQNRDF